ncbi:hypothetical protein [Streptomyces sp. NBC_01465]|uniref:hypothetical protein n=1 Tax=Streptomyces sp. NBC_01465 TaxID=2903878 RepID=UPI002E327186|nr:hypothetical protein [Streptomyces sp. NBC_01465]
MAEPQSSARLRAPAEAPTSGVIHVRTRHTANFTVLSNRLAQRAGSAVTVGVAAYILSLPDGAPIRIEALCAHFSEGEILIARALRELEAEGWIERRVERGPGGRIRTRTFVYDLPGAVDEPAGEVLVDVPVVVREEASSAPADPRAVAVLAALRQRDRRLVLAEREVVRLAPAVVEWLELGVSAVGVVDALTCDLPASIQRRPARLIAYRLRELKPVGVGDVVELPVVLPFQTCDGCERAFRAEEPGRCRECGDSCAA